MRRPTGKRCSIALLGTMVSLLAACGLQGAGEDPLTDEHPDPRAVRGSDPDISLDQALQDLRFDLPPGAGQVRFKSRNDSAPYYLNLTFTVPCRQVTEVVQDNDLIDLRQADGPHSIGEDALKRAAEAVGVQVPSGPSLRFYASKSDLATYKRGALHFALDGSSCRFVAAVEDYG